MQKSNHLINLFSPHDAALLRPHLRNVHLEQQRVLAETGGHADTVYFPLDAIVSLVVALSSGEIIEVAMVGRDGAVSVGAALDGRISLSRAIVQLAGDALACDVGALKHLAAGSPELVAVLMKHEQFTYSQAQQSAACMATHALEARLCRWLLRARDLVDSDTLQFTQEFLAQMLGVRRSSVSVVAHTLQEAGMIKYARGRIQIVDIDALRETVCECYGTLKSLSELLLGENSQGRKPT
jgi:CRP-like cAMP-binding protein